MGEKRCSAEAPLRCVASFPLSDLWEVFRGSSAAEDLEAEANKTVQGLNNW